MIVFRNFLISRDSLLGIGHDNQKFGIVDNVDPKKKSRTCVAIDFQQHEILVTALHKMFMDFFITTMNDPLMTCIRCGVFVDPAGSSAQFYHPDIDFTKFPKKQSRFKLWNFCVPITEPVIGVQTKFENEKCNDLLLRNHSL